MAENNDVNMILEIFLYNDLANISDMQESLRFPIGFRSLIRTAVINNIPTLRFPSDLREILVDYILVRERGDFLRLKRLANHQITRGLKKQRREFFR